MTIVVWVGNLSLRRIVTSVVGRSVERDWLRVSLCIGSIPLLLRPVDWTVNKGVIKGVAVGFRRQGSPLLLIVIVNVRDVALS